MIIDFRGISEDNKQHHRIFNAVYITPENAKDRKQPYLVSFEFEYIEKYNDKQVGEKMRSHHQVPIYDYQCTTNGQEKTDQYLNPIFALPDKEKTDNKGSQEIKEASQDYQAIISCPLKYLINNDLKQPVVAIPRFRRRNIRKKCIFGNGPILPKISSPGQMVPQVCIVSHNRPGNKVVDQDYKKNED